MVVKIRIEPTHARYHSRLPFSWAFVAKCQLFCRLVLRKAIEKIAFKDSLQEWLEIIQTSAIAKVFRHLIACHFNWQATVERKARSIGAENIFLEVFEVYD